MSPQNREQQRWRLAIAMELNAVCQNLRVSQSCYFREKHRILFKHAYILKTQRNRIIHQYGLPDSRLNWKAVWQTVNFDLEHVLLPELIQIIDQESARESLELEEELQDTKNDRSNNTNFQTSENETNISIRQGNLNFERHRESWK